MKNIKILSLVLAVVIIVSSLSMVGCNWKDLFGGGKNPSAVDPINDNYRTFYHIFVGSFSDGNNDGTGDLLGVINRLDYLNDGDINNGNDLGVQGIWLSPIFSSPSYHKYDASNYYEIDWRFGETATLKRLIEMCHERNVKIILDLAINHTSNQHPWFIAFKEARKAGDVDSKYYDWYSCVSSGEYDALRRDGDERTFQKIGGTDWYYECNFTSDMPELNFNNIDVQEAMLDVARYYLKMGVDGFRFDAVKYIYYGDILASATFWNYYMGILREEYPDIYVVGECWSQESEILSYYASMNCFNFEVSSSANDQGRVAIAARGNSNVYSYTKYIESLQNKIYEKNKDGMMISFLNNHDMDRIGGAFVTDNNMKMAANLYLLTPGSPFIYYGEEIGLLGSRGNANTDANRRLAMLWGDDDLVKDPVGSTYANQIDSSVAEQLKDENSLLRHYSKLIAIRHKYPEIARGTYTAFSTTVKTFGGFRVTYGEDKLIILHNTSVNSVEYDLSTISHLSGFTTFELCDYIGVSYAALEGTVITLGPQTSAIIK